MLETTLYIIYARFLFFFILIISPDKSTAMRQENKIILKEFRVQKTGQVKRSNDSAKT